MAQIVNIGTYNIRPWGWRLSLGLAAIPGTILLLGGIFLPDSPNSLVERGQVAEGKQVLQRIRGTPQVEEEFLTILAAQEVGPFVAMTSLSQHTFWTFWHPYHQQTTGCTAKTPKIIIEFRCCERFDSLWQTIAHKTDSN